MTIPKLFVLDPYHPDALALLRNTPTLDLIPPDSDSLHEWHAEATGLLIRSETRITAQDLDRTTKLKVIVKQGVGVDNIDLAAARRRGVAVCNTPALNGEAVAELTVALALCLARRVAELDRRVRRGEAVVRARALGQSLYRKTIGIVGMGNVGTCVAEKWRGAMAGPVIGFDPFAAEEAWAEIPHRRVRTLEELLRDADVVSLHVPLTSETRGMIGTEQLAAMRKNAILLNCARGGLVDETALGKAIREKRIWGAALDAMEVEPPTLEAYEELLQNENVILMPHVGASTEENQSRSGIFAAETAIRVLEGEDVANRVA